MNEPSWSQSPATTIRAKTWQRRVQVPTKTLEARPNRPTLTTKKWWPSPRSGCRASKPRPSRRWASRKLRATWTYSLPSTDACSLTTRRRTTTTGVPAGAPFASLTAASIGDARSTTPGLVLVTGARTRSEVLYQLLPACKHCFAFGTTKKRVVFRSKTCFFFSHHYGRRLQMRIKYKWFDGCQFWTRWSSSTVTTYTRKRS